MVASTEHSTPIPIETKKGMIEKNLSNINLLDAMENSDSCPLCYLWLKSERRYLEYLLTNEVTMDPGFRERILSAKGFCNRHMHLLYKTAQGVGTEDGLGYGLYLQSIVGEVSQELESLPLQINGRAARKGITIWGRKRKQAITQLAKEVSKVYQGKRCCPVCEFLWSSDQMNLHTLLQMLDEKDFREAFKSSGVLCLPHFVSAIEMVSRSDLKNPAEVARSLIDLEVGLLERLGKLLSEFIRKQDWEFREEPQGPEVKAYSLALGILVGVEGLYSYGLKAHIPLGFKEGQYRLLLAKEE